MGTVEKMPAPSVLLIGNYPPDGQQSMRRYAEFLYGELRSRGFKVDLIQPDAVFGRLFRGSEFLSKWMGTLDKYLVFPFRLRLIGSRYAVAHICDHSNAFYLHYLKRKACLVTCHDLFGIKSELGHYPETAGRTSLQHRRRMAWTLSSLKETQNVVCVSDKTKEDLVELLGSPPPRLVTIPHSLNWEFAPMLPERVEAILGDLDPRIGDRYFLHVGGNQWYKNRAGVIRIFLSLKKFPAYRSVKLVMAGKAWTAEMRALCEGPEGRDVVEIVGPSNEQVQALYAGAIALIFPSLQEGFGWPILEAQACGCPVITSNRAPMTEIAGASAILIDPTDPESAAARIDEGLECREEMIRAGFENLKRFAKEGIIDQYCALYGQIAAGATATVP